MLGELKPKGTQGLAYLGLRSRNWFGLGFYTENGYVPIQEAIPMQRGHAQTRAF